MKVYHKLEEITDITNPVLTTGTFDGVHLGHRKIIDSLKRSAREANGESVIFTFYPHPRMVIFPDDNDLKLLSSQEEKIALLEAAGVDHLVIYPFTKDFSRLSALEFVRDILVQKIGMKKMVIGYDHQFGKNREGNLEHLQELAPLFDFSVEEIPAQDVDHINVSSTKIRRALLEGDLTTANKYLGYTYKLSGTVKEGQKLGRTIGYPTANIVPDFPHKLVPGFGVYAVKIHFGGQQYGGMLNIGIRPTVSSGSAEPTIEVNIFGLDADLYGKKLTVEFISSLRNEMKFPSVEALKEQLHADKQHAIQVLGLG